MIIAKSQGWTVSARGWWSHPTLPDNGGAMSSPPDYYWDVSYAVTLCDVLAKEGWNVDINKRHDWTVTVWGNGDEHYESRAPTLAAAICESYAKVKGLW